MPKKTVAKKQATKKQKTSPKRKEREVMLPPAPGKPLTPDHVLVNSSAGRKRAAANRKRLPNQDPDAQPSWTPEREVEYLQQRLATAKEGLARHQNEVWAHQALIKTLEDSLETAMGELLVEEPVPSTKRSNR